MKIIKIIRILSLIALVSCSSSDRKPTIHKSGNITFTENYIKLCYGIETKVDTSNLMEHAIQLLNTSDIKKCLELFKRSFHKLDTVSWHSGFFGLIIPDSNIKSNKRPDLNYYNPINYLSFRYNNFVGDLAKDEQSFLLGASISIPHSDDLYSLQFVEGGILSFNKTQMTDTSVVKKTIKDVEYLLKEYPESKRLKYILGTSYLELGQDSKAIRIYDHLISENYYALPCLKTIINNLGERNRYAEQKKYLTIFKRMFPNECILSQLFHHLSIDSVREICANCIETGSQRDSIHASIFLAKYFFNNQAYNQLDSMMDIYFMEHKYAASYDDLKVLEERIYPDLKMRELFLLGKYNQMFNYSNFIHLKFIEMKIDFKNYAKSLYTEYISKDTSKFDIFYNNNFEPPPRKKWGNKYHALYGSDSTFFKM